MFLAAQLQRPQFPADCLWRNTFCFWARGLLGGMLGILFLALNSERLSPRNTPTESSFPKGRVPNSCGPFGAGCFCCVAVAVARCWLGCCRCSGAVCVVAVAVARWWLLPLRWRGGAVLALLLPLRWRGLRCCRCGGAVVAVAVAVARWRGVGFVVAVAVARSTFSLR